MQAEMNDPAEKHVDKLFSLVPTVSMLCVRKQADNMLSRYRRQHEFDVRKVSGCELQIAVSISSSANEFRLEGRAEKREEDDGA